MTTPTDPRPAHLFSQESDSTTPSPHPGTGRLLEGLHAHDTVTMARLRERLVDQAQREGILDVAYRTLDTPVGPLLLAATEQGLIRVAYAVQDHDAVLRQLADVISPRVLNAPGRLDDVARQMEEYFAGRRTRFDVPLDWRLSKGFRRQVLARLPDIGYGRTESYAQVAVATGNPRAVRAVGTACATNPLPVVVPCHRVVRSDGSLGGYAGGADAKHALLTLEATT
jgi:methylated-DNA-[protein]-cysteine S-methyltransferase